MNDPYIEIESTSSGSFWVIYNGEYVVVNLVDTIEEAHQRVSDWTQTPPPRPTRGVIERYEIKGKSPSTEAQLSIERGYAQFLAGDVVRITRDELGLPDWTEDNSPFTQEDLRNAIRDELDKQTSVMKQFMKDEMDRRWPQNIETEDKS